ncbi:MAG: GNAT family N-acetyltransferase [Quinella sp. 3Q1]|nr:GNAT family N-acetyltransferase [Quinella sp. 3Q1]MBR3051406.1 GNAT family N-acetyltransferase [Selenomonadaceae bacterium]
MLFGELIKAVKLRGARAITLEVRPSNTAAIKLYKSFGLRSVGRRKGYYLDNGEDALIMWNTRL